MGTPISGNSNFNSLWKALDSNQDGRVQSQEARVFTQEAKAAGLSPEKAQEAFQAAREANLQAFETSSDPDLASIPSLDAMYLEVEQAFMSRQPLPLPSPFLTLAVQGLQAAASSQIQPKESSAPVSESTPEPDLPDSSEVEIEHSVDLLPFQSKIDALATPDSVRALNRQIDTLENVSVDLLNAFPPDSPEAAATDAVIELSVALSRHQSGGFDAQFQTALAQVEAPQNRAILEDLRDKVVQLHTLKPALEYTDTLSERAAIGLKLGVLAEVKDSYGVRTTNPIVALEDFFETHGMEVERSADEQAVRDLTDSTLRDVYKAGRDLLVPKYAEIEQRLDTWINRAKQNPEGMWAEVQNFAQTNGVSEAQVLRQMFSMTDSEIERFQTMLRPPEESTGLEVIGDQIARVIFEPGVELLEHVEDLRDSVRSEKEELLSKKDHEIGLKDAFEMLNRHTSIRRQVYRDMRFMSPISQSAASSERFPPVTGGTDVAEAVLDGRVTNEREMVFLALAEDWDDSEALKQGFLEAGDFLLSSLPLVGTGWTVVRELGEMAVANYNMDETRIDHQTGDISDKQLDEQGAETSFSKALWDIGLDIVVDQAAGKVLEKGQRVWKAERLQEASQKALKSDLDDQVLKKYMPGSDQDIYALTRASDDAYSNALSASDDAYRIAELGRAQELSSLASFYTEKMQHEIADFFVEVGMSDTVAEELAKKSVKRFTTQTGVGLHVNTLKLAPDALGGEE